LQFKGLQIQHRSLF